VELYDLGILPKNVYNMDEIRVMLSMLVSLKVLVGKDNPQTYKGEDVERTMMTVIERISIDRRPLSFH
jgi:hypothetical protein